jgi:hypothetical protein
MRRFEASPRRAAPKGHKTFIFRTAPFPEADLQPTSFHAQDAIPGALRLPGLGDAADRATRLVLTDGGRRLLGTVHWEEELSKVVRFWSAHDPVLVLDAAIDRLMGELSVIKAALQRLGDA